MSLLVLPHGAELARRRSFIILPTDIGATLSRLPATGTVHVQRARGKDGGSTHTGLPARVPLIREAFEYLKKNNPQYRDVSWDRDREQQCELSTTQDEPPPVVRMGQDRHNVQTGKSDTTIVLPWLDYMPVDVLRVAGAEENAFPWLYPQGVGGMCSPRPQRIPVSTCS